MTLMQVIKRLEDVALAQPPVKQIIENDAYRLNGLPDAKYGVFAFTQGRHTASLGSSQLYYTFTLMYIDRLTESHDNEIYVQSTGVTVLDNICRTLALEWDITDWAIQTFTQRFLDDCAGAYVEVRIGVPVEYGGTCEEDFSDTGWGGDPEPEPEEPVEP